MVFTGIVERTGIVTEIVHSKNLKFKHQWSFAKVSRLEQVYVSMAFV